MFQRTHTHAYRALALIAVLSVWYVQHSDVHAQGIGIKVQPSTIEERLDPGESMTGALTVTNENGGKQTYYIGTRNIVSQNEGGTPAFSDVPSTDPMEAASWIKPTLESVSLEVGESATIPYTIQVPSNASPGSYFAAIFVTREADEVTESGTGVGFQVASIAILRVNGSVVEGLTVNEFSTDRSAYKNRTVEFSARMTNTGTVHQRPLGIINVTDMLGNELEPVLQLNESAGVVMPREERVFTAVWEPEGFAFGRYTATLSTVYGETDRQTIVNRTTFWVFPIKEIGTVIGVVLALLIATMLAVRRYVRFALARAGVRENTREADQIESFPKRLMRTLMWLSVFVVLMFIGVVVFFA